MYFRFPRHHANISGRDVTELYMAIAALGVFDNAWKAHGRISYSFGDTEAKVDWGILPPSCRDKG